MLPSVKASSEMEKLKQLNSFLVKELKDSKNEIAKLKGENKVLKEKYEKMRDNIKKLISPEDMELKIGDSPNKKSLSLADEITNKDIEIISIEEEEGTSNSKDNFNKMIEFPFHKIIDTILNPSTDKQSTTIDKFHKPKEINTVIAVAPINKSTKESDCELITKETIINVRSRSFDEINYGNNASNTATTKPFGNAGSTPGSASIFGGEKSSIQQSINVTNFGNDDIEKIRSKNHSQITAKKSFIALTKPEDDKEISKEKISSKVETNDEEMEMTGTESLLIKWIEEKITHPHQGNDSSKIQTIIDTNNEEKEMICPLCFQIFTKITRFENHIVVHKGSMPELNQETQCPKSDCSLTFPNRVDLCSHYQKTHNEEATPCGICLKVFRNTKMKLHLLSNHSTNKPMKLQKIEIKKNLSGKRKKKENERSNMSRLERKAAKKYPCEICQQTFTKKSSVKTHIDTVHLKLKPHKCEDCGKSFLQASHLNFHSDIHNNIRFRCTFCKKDFSRRHVLNEHIKKHTENKLKDHISILFNKS